MIAESGTQSIINTSKYFIISSSTNYKNNVLYYFSTYKTGFLTMPGTKKKQFRSKSIVQEV